jgi:methyl-accepting chemotaxis protein
MTPAAPKAEAPRRAPVKPSTEAAKPKLTSRKAPVLRKAAAKPIDRAASEPVSVAIPASLAKAKPLVAAGDDSDWETF